MRRPLRNHTPIRTIFHIEIIFDETKGDVMDVSTSMPKSKGSHTRRQAHGVSRRNFVKTGAAVGMAASLAGMAGCTFDKGSDGAESHEQSVDPWADCEEFFAACPPECQHHNLRALVRNGKVVKVDCGASNESKPCMMGMSRIGWLNSPDRLTMPLLRDGEKGENAWKEISWDEAFDLIAEKLEDAIDTIGNQAIVIDGHAGNFNAIPGSAMSAFVARLGGTMTLSGSLCCAAMNESTKVSFGKRFMDLRNQFENADYMLVWGNNPAVTMNGYFSRFMHVMDKGGTIVTIDPVCSETAAKSTEWVPIKPTTDTALAMGMLKVIVDEGLTDESFLKEHTTFPALVDADGAAVMESDDDPTSMMVIDSNTGELVRHDAEGVDPLLSMKGTEHEGRYSTVYDLTVDELQEWTPEAVEAETSVPAEKVVEIARAYASAERAMIIQNMGGFMRISYGNYACQAMNNLALFTGHIGHKGDGVADAGGINNIIKLSPMFENPKPKEGLPTIPRVQFAQHVMDDDPNPVKVFISARESPMTQFPNTELVKQALRKIPFVVVIDSLMTSTALYADLVLPCTTVFETEDILLNGRSHLIQLSQKAVEAPGEAHDDLWIFTKLAERMGFGEDFQHDNAFFIQKALEGTDYTYEQLQKEHAIDAYPADFIPYEDGNFYTKTGKAEVYMSNWVAKGFKPVVTYMRCPETVGGSSGLGEKYPLAAVQRKLNRSVHSTFASLTRIEALSRDYACAMLNDEDAAARGIADGDACVVYNDRGEHKARAIVTTHVMKGVICLENGWWEQQGGSSSYVTNDAAGPIATEHCCNETLVEIRKEA